MEKMKTMLKTSAMAAVFAALMLFIAGTAMAASPGGTSKSPAGGGTFPIVIDPPVIVDRTSPPDGDAGNVIAGWDLSSGLAGGGDSGASGDGGSDVPLTHAVPPGHDDTGNPDDTCDPGEPGYPGVDDDPETPVIPDPTEPEPEPETPRQPLRQSSSLPNTGTQLALLAAAALAVTGGAWAVRQKGTKR